METFVVFVVFGVDQSCFLNKKTAIISAKKPIGQQISSMFPLDSTKSIKNLTKIALKPKQI